MKYMEGMGDIRPLPTNQGGKHKPTFSESLCHLVGFLVTACVAVLLLTALILLMVTSVGSSMGGQLQGDSNVTAAADPASYNTKMEWQLGVLFLIFGCALSIGSVLYFCYVAKYSRPIFGFWTIRVFKSNSKNKIPVFNRIGNREMVYEGTLNSSNDSRKNLTQFAAMPHNSDAAVPTAPEISFGEQSFQKNSTPRVEEDALAAKAASESLVNVSIEYQKQGIGYAEEPAINHPSTSFVQDIAQPSTSFVQDTAQPSTSFVQDNLLQSTGLFLQETEARRETIAIEDTRHIEQEISVISADADNDVQHLTPAAPSPYTEDVSMKVAKTTGVGPVEVLSLLGNSNGGLKNPGDPVYTMHIGEKLKMDVTSPECIPTETIYSTTAVQQVGEKAHAPSECTERASTVLNIGEVQTGHHGISVRVGEQEYDLHNTTSQSSSNESNFVVRSIKHWQAKSLDFDNEYFEEETACEDTATSSFAYVTNDDVFLPPTPVSVIAHEQNQSFAEPILTEPSVPEHQTILPEVHVAPPTAQVNPSTNTIVYQPKSYTNASSYEPYPEISTMVKQREAIQEQATSTPREDTDGTAHFYHNVVTLARPDEHVTTTPHTVIINTGGNGGTIDSHAPEVDEYLTPREVSANMAEYTGRRSVRFELDERASVTNQQPQPLSPWKGVKDIETPYILHPTLNKQPVAGPAAVPYPEDGTYQQSPMVPLANPLFNANGTPRNSALCDAEGTPPNSITTNGSVIEVRQIIAEMNSAVEVEEPNPFRLDLSGLVPRPPTPPRTYKRAASPSPRSANVPPSPIEQVWRQPAIARTDTLQHMLDRSQNRLTDAQQIGYF